ncbi:hypothetical protein [Roseateles chitinivorans]|uniref:hypothetical protein n=2 Tax=Roseateles TaxID=93681 RepID=UPI003D67C7A6
MKTVFILGAGASRAAGGPLMFDFIDAATRIFRLGEAGWAQPHFEGILDARRKLQGAFVKSTIDIDNIENLFSTYEMASLIGRLSDLDESVVKQLPKSLRYLIMRTLEQAILYPIDGKEQVIPAPYPYDAFAELLIELRDHREASPVTVINFNYDLCLDYALTLRGFEPDYGLAGSPVRSKRSIAHYKVHGSLNWFRNPETGEIAPQPLRKLPMRTYWDRLGLEHPAERPIDTMELIYGPDKWGMDLYPEPIIVPPTWNKGWYQEQLKSVWRSASEALAAAENIFVIGYSLPASDQFFRSFYSLSTISDSFIERFWLFDPSPKTDVVERFSSLLGPAIIDRGRFRFECEKFDGAIKRLAEHFGYRTENFAGR